VTLLSELPPCVVIASPALSGVAISQLEQQDFFAQFILSLSKDWQ
jgi:hypothetical protein